MLITARTTSDLSALDFHVYDEPEENLYVHHDLMLPSFPLCVEWLDFDPSSSTKPGSYVAVGTFDPSIEIWDADMVDGLYPHAILGPAPSLEKPEMVAKGTGKKKRRQVVADPNYHLQPVLSLSWTPNHRHLLLSGSADATIKLWDLTRESPMAAVTSWDNVHGGEKVSAVEWNKSASGNGLDKAVLSAGYDRVVKVWDSRAVGEGIGIKMGSDVECVRWDPWEPTSFYVSQWHNNLALCSPLSRCRSRTVSSSLTTRVHCRQRLSRSRTALDRFRPLNPSSPFQHTTARPLHSTSTRTSGDVSPREVWTRTSRSGMSWTRRRRASRAGRGKSAW